MNQLRSPLIWRLILWFLLLSLIPIGIVLVFVQRQVRNAIVEQQIQGLSDQARLLAMQIEKQPESAQEFLEGFGSTDRVVFLLDPEGKYLAHSDSNKIGTLARNDLDANVLRDLLREPTVQIRDTDSGQYIVSANIDTVKYVIVIAEKSEAQSGNIDDLAGSITLQLAVSLLITSLAGGTAILVVLGPVVQLSNFADRLAGGELESELDDNELEGELATLAKSLNNLAVRVRSSITTLEQRVAERTADVELARLVSERRAQELQSISEISRTISTEQRLEILLPLVTRLVSERFDYYHTGIFFMDDTKQFAVLQASNSEGGKRMLARSHQLEVGTGMVGTVALSGKPRIALDVGADAVFFDNPDLSETRSEMALPLNFRGQTIGVLDVQSIKPGAFTQEDANTLTILADQIAIAIENARLFSQTQQAREEAETLYSQFLRAEWKNFLKEDSKVGYRKTISGGQALEKPVQNEEIRQALREGKAVVVDGNNEHARPSIAVPVKLRGQIIGILNITAPKNRKWNNDEIGLAQAVSDRLALALDNARLLHESQRRAAKEAKIGEVTAKIGASINMRNVLQTAVEELGRALPGSEIMIQFQSSQEN
jgi:GAF domain-containing protein